MHKLSKSAKILSLCLFLGMWILLIRELAYGFFTLRSFLSLIREPAKEINTTINGITQNFLSIYSDQGIPVSREALLAQNLLSMVSSFVRAPLFCYGLHLLRKILAPIAQQRPFSGTSALLKKLAWISVALAAVQNLIEYSVVYQYKLMQISQLFEGSAITRIEYLFEPDITYILLAVVLFILCAVFRYGEELQQLSDETL